MILIMMILKIYTIRLNFSQNYGPNLQWFQYRINHNIIVANAFSHKIKIRDDSFCTFCGKASETIVHMF